MASIAPTVKVPFCVIAFPDRKRRAAIRRRLAPFGIEPRFFDAVSGKDLHGKDRHQFSCAGREYWRNGPMREGAMGCSLSHFSVWEAMLDEGLEAAVVLEDDAIATSAGKSILNDRINWLYDHRDRIDLVMLHQRYARPFLSVDGSDGHDPCIGLFRHSDIGAESYFITAKCARYLLTRPDRFIFEVDAFLQHWWRHDPVVHILHHRPPLFKEEGRDSLIGYTDTPIYPSNPVQHRIARKWNRFRDSLYKRLRFSSYLAHARRHHSVPLR